MLKGEDDGYDKILLDARVGCPGAPTDLKGIVRAAMAPSSKGAGLVEIAPKDEGRVCEVHDVARSTCAPASATGGTRP